MTVLIVQNNTSVFGENGLVIVGGVLNPKEHELADLPRYGVYKRILFVQRSLM